VVLIGAEDVEMYSLFLADLNGRFGCSVHNLFVWFCVHQNEGVKKWRSFI